jgi:glycosyltransferase involved in cell wall biosynthesis
MMLSDGVVVFSQYAKRLVKTHYYGIPISKVSVVPGFIDDSEIKPGLTKRDYGEREHFKNQLTVLNIGRAEPRKGINYLLEAFGILQERGKKHKLVLASPVNYWCWFGIPQLYERLNLFLNIHLIHAINEDQEKELLAKADLFLMPSYELETFGMTVIESLAQGIPVVAAKSGALSEIIGKVDRQLLTKPKSSVAIANKIEWYSNLAPQERRNLEQRSIETVRNFYSYKVVSPRIIKIYQSLFK